MKKLLMTLIPLLLLASFTNDSHAYKLVMIRSISNTEKTFLVKIGAQHGINEKMEATFTNDNISLVAIAIKVTREESLWRIKEPYGKIPFNKDQIVTFNYSTERVWLLDPEKYIEELSRKRAEALSSRSLEYRSERPRNITIKAFGISGVTETVSVQSSHEISSREGYLFETEFNRFYSNGFQLGIGGRFEQEKTESQTVTAIAKRTIAFGSVSYYFRPFSKLETTYTYAGTSLGLGNVQTQIGPMKMSGQAMLFPSVFLGVESMLDLVALVGEIGWETINSKERFPTGDRQDTSVTNIKIGIGIVYFLNKKSLNNSVY